MSNLPQQTTINQYVADGISTQYNYLFYVLTNPDMTYTINVYVTQPNATPNPTADLQLQGTAYTVTPNSVNPILGGIITFQTGYIPIAGAIVTVSRFVQNAIDTQFSVASYISGQNLDAAFQLLMLVVQQNTTLIQERCLRYAIDSYLPSTVNNILPVLTNTNNQIWISQNGAIVAALLVEGEDVSVLRSQLANATVGADGAGIVGYYDSVTNTAQTVHSQLVADSTAITTLNTNVAALQVSVNNLQQFASIYLSTSFPVAANTAGIIPFDTALYDPEGLFNGAGFIVKVAGYYRVNCSIFLTPSTPGNNRAQVALLKNGTGVQQLASTNQLGSYNQATGQTQILCAVNDYLEINFTNSASSTTDVQGGSPNSSFDIEYLGV